MFVVTEVADFPAGVTSQTFHFSPAQSRVLMERMTFLMTYKVRPLMSCSNALSPCMSVSGCSKSEIKENLVLTNAFYLYIWQLV